MAGSLRQPYASGMAQRELVVLGTASQVPTRARNHNGYLLRWDDQLILFDPGEGAQRQLTLAGVSPARITAICVTHVHGDHCLGLPGILQRMSLDRVTRPVPLIFPEAGAVYIDRLRHASAYDDRLDVRLHPVSGSGPVIGLGRDGPSLTVETAPLDHRIPAQGYRLIEPDGYRMLPAELDAAGIKGPDIGRLQADGRLQTAHGEIRREDVSVRRPGQRFAFVMDTRPCVGADALAERADLLVAEATFADADAELAESYGHLTARQAGQLATRCGARRLVISHFSQRYENLAALLAEAAGVHDDVVLAEDLARIPVPSRRPIPGSPHSPR
jgi:ribonuclease Z